MTRDQEQHVFLPLTSSYKIDLSFVFKDINDIHAEILL